MKVYSPLEVAFFEGLAADPVTELGRGRFYMNTGTNKIRYYDGSDWRTAGGGGGGGGGAVWHGPDGSSPLESEENSEKVWLFEAGLDQELYIWVRVPAEYTEGTQIKMNVGYYTPEDDGAATELIQSTTYLVEPGDAMNGVGKNHDSGNSATANPGTADAFINLQLNLTDASGLCNGSAVQAGDLLRVKLTRGTDTDTEDVRFVPSATEFIFS